MEINSPAGSRTQTYRAGRIVEQKKLIFHARKQSNGLKIDFHSCSLWPQTSGSDNYDINHSVSVEHEVEGISSS